MQLATPWVIAVCAVGAAAGCKGEQAPPPPAETAAGEPLKKETRDGPVLATVSIAPAKPKLGDTITLTLTVEAEPKVAVEMPPFGEALGRFAVVDFTPRQTRRNDGGTISTHIYRLDAPMSGRQRIPPLRVEFVDERQAGSAEPRELLTEEISLDIESVLPAGASTAELRPARGELPETVGAGWWKRWWPVLAIGAAVVCAATALVLLRRGARRKKRVSAYRVALTRLRALEARGFPTADQADAWYVELSGIIRRYLEDRYRLRAPELTTEEFLREAQRSSELSPGHRELLTAFLADCDRVKFAAYRPEQAESREALETSRRFVEETRVVEEMEAAA